MADIPAGDLPYEWIYPQQKPFFYPRPGPSPFVSPWIEPLDPYEITPVIPAPLLPTYPTVPAAWPPEPAWPEPGRPVVQHESETPKRSMIKTSKYLPRELAEDPQWKALLKMAEKDEGCESMGPCADWLEEKGATDLALAFRWAFKRGKRPFLVMPNRWLWRDADATNSETRSTLPDSLWAEMTGRVLNDASIVLRSFRNAMIALADALKKVRDEIEA